MESRTDSPPDSLGSANSQARSAESDGRQTRNGCASPYYAWIVHGLDLFDDLVARGVEVIEVFPTASWTRWQSKRAAEHGQPRAGKLWAALYLEGVPARTNQDQRDAIAAAITARQHTQGLTETMGDIVVPAASPLVCRVSGNQQCEHD
jgi:hypothetical protein